METTDVRLMNIYVGVLQAQIKDITENWLLECAKNAYLLEINADVSRQLDEAHDAASSRSDKIKQNPDLLKYAEPKKVDV